MEPEKPDTERERDYAPYAPEAFESRWYEFWIQQDLFRAGRPRDLTQARAQAAGAGGDAATAAKGPAASGAGARPFTIVIPPPNITGKLHFGHALNNTLQDILVRWKRMQGFDTLWLPGTDHAGIATQMVVERDLRARGLSRHDLGREKFLEEVWRWRDKHGGEILATLKKLGASCDWSRLRFTLDEGLSRAVREVFVSLYEDGLIYQAEDLINWCPSCRTALSDLEVAVEEGAKGTLWEIAYPLADGGGELIVATTRPETMLGDTAVAIHPDDPRYRGLAGREAILPLVERRIPIITDAILVDPAFGTGVVKVTPGHDFNDFETGKRHGLPLLSVMDEAGRINAQGGPYAGLDRFEARKKILADLEARGLLRGSREHVLPLRRCDRCETIVEPFFSRQWFVRIESLARPALAAVESGKIAFVPEQWTKTYFEWMRKIHDWCISRQLWWGHRIPAWHCGAGHVTVARETPRACATCGAGELRQDEDVLDTWFSSALWPFSTLGWPDQSEDLRRYYPTSVLSTGPDIIFFWVARMIMMGLRFCGEIPFREVYFHGLVRDAKGQKMSKTKGNVIDPDDMIRDYGADPVRFTLAILASPGTDIPVARERMDGYRAFANKLWNASRFVLMNLVPEEGRPPLDRSRLETVDRWILGRLERLAREVDADLAGFRFDLAANRLYHFIWHEFCDWYIEWVKPDLMAGRGRQETPFARPEAAGAAGSAQAAAESSGAASEETAPGAPEASRTSGGRDSTAAAQPAAEADAAAGPAFANVAEKNAPARAGDPARSATVRAVLVEVLDGTLRLLHPFMPFVTEELWQRLPGHGLSIAVAPYPQGDPAREDPQAEGEIGAIVELVGTIRNLRAESGIDPARRIPLLVRPHAPEDARILARHRGAVAALARCESIDVEDDLSGRGPAARGVTDRFEAAIPLAGVLDIAAESRRLQKERERIDKEIGTRTRKLADEVFLARAPAAVIEKEKGIQRELSEKRARIDRILASLGG